MDAVIQIACVKWGTKYGASHVNRLYAAVARATTRRFRFVCITDAPGDAYAAGVLTRPFPVFALPHHELTEGCRLKLALFSPDTLEPDLPTVFFDLDVAVTGDVAALADRVGDDGAIQALKSHFLTFPALEAFIRRVRPDFAFFANSSVLTFRPRQCHSIFDDFNRLSAEAPAHLAKQLASDDRFLSYIARGRLRLLPRRLAVKYRDEFMAPLAVWETMRAVLPWVKARRRTLVAVAFVGWSMRPERLATLRQGEVFRVGWLAARWTQARLVDYWREPGGHGT